MLAADWIEYLALKAGMIHPFKKENLKPASYELTLGPEWQHQGKIGRLTEDEPILTIPPNSIVFASMQETLALPHYIAARFDLSIEFIYKGLLLGTGPQVDPWLLWTPKLSVA
jgi:deoxycytidine triphosphate deaminase